MMAQQVVEKIRRKVLIIEDDQDIRELVAEIISSDFQVIFASNGEQGLDLARKYVPDAILLDFKMPGMNGLEVCRSLKANEETSQIKVIMLTSFNDVKTRTELFREGIVDFIGKPFDPEELLVRLHARFSAHEHSDKTKINGFFAPKESVIVGWDGLTLDVSQRKLTFLDTNHSLREIECKILHQLLHAQGNICSRKEISHAVWGTGEEGDRNLDPHVSTLRRTLKEIGFDIKAAYGLGYSITKLKAPQSA